MWEDTCTVNKCGVTWEDTCTVNKCGVTWEDTCTVDKVLALDGAPTGLYSRYSTVLRENPLYLQNRGSPMKFL
jgi:hypothetical protein